MQISRLSEEAEREGGGNRHGREPHDPTGLQDGRGRDLDHLSRGQTGDERSDREPSVGDLEREAGKTALVVPNAIREPGLPARRQGVREATLHGDVPDHAFRKPTAQEKEPQHCAEEEVEEVVSRVDGR
jgi:hypothetical protein